MKILVLGGNSQRHYGWIRQLKGALEPFGHEVVLHDYKHWESGDPMADIEYEIGTVARRMADVTSYMIIAKSIGTVIAALGTARGELSPSRIVMLGTPYEGVAGEIPEFISSLEALPYTMFVQNQYDPYGSADGLHKLLTDHSPVHYELTSVPDNTTHDYLDFTFINQLLTK